MQTYLVLSFLNPSVLWGLLAISIPIIIHLFNLRQVKKVEFSNIALLKRVKEETSAKKKPVELLILLARILFVAFLVIAFAQPISKDEDNALELNENVLIYLDNSLSMQKAVGTQTSAFDQAFAYANVIVDAYPDNAKFKFIENNYSNSLVVNYSKETIKDRLTELEFSSVSRSIPEIQKRLANSEFNGDIYLISDFQKSGEPSLASMLSDTTNNYYMVPIGSEESGNLYFDSAYLENSFLLGELKNELKVSVRNDGDQALDDVNLRLFFDNQLTSTALVDIDANGSLIHAFEIDRDAAGLDRVRVSLEDAQVDFDNELFLTLNNIEKINVFEIRESVSGSYVSQLYGDNELFNFQSFNTGNIDLNQLTGADLIVLNQISSFSNQLTSAINDFLEAEGSVLMIPSRNLAAGRYSDFGLRVTEDSRQRVQLNNPDLNNPFFAGVFEEDAQNISMPEATTYLRLRNQELSLLDFKNGRSFLSKATTDGSLYFFSSSFEAGMTSFPNHSIFVPVMYKLALGSKVNLSRLYYSTNDETIVYPTELKTSGGVINLKRGDVELTPDQRFSGSNLVMEIPKDEIGPGHFDVKSTDTNLGVIAFNLPKEESGGDRFSTDELLELAQANHINMIEADDAMEVDREITAGIKGIGLWRYALLLALLFLFVEIILIRYL